MKKFGGYDEAKKNAQYSASEKLPAGAYVARIMGVRYEAGEDGKSDRIAVQFDIEEGEFKNFFKNQYDANTSEDKKWKGRATVYVPTDDGSERDGWTKNAFAKWTNSLEDSNPGYAWDWDENKWKGKLIGLVFRNAGTVIEGREVTYTEVAFPIDIKTVKDGKAPEAKFKARNGYTGNGASSSAPAQDASFVNVPEGIDEEIPF